VGAATILTGSNRSVQQHTFTHTHLFKHWSPLHWPPAYSQVPPVAGRCSQQAIASHRKTDFCLSSSQRQSKTTAMCVGNGRAVALLCLVAAFVVAGEAKHAVQVLRTSQACQVD
jgi:hypothetical protein